MSTEAAEITKLRERVIELESHIPRIGHVEHDVITLSGKHSNLDREIAEVKDLLVNLEQQVSDLESMKKQAVSNQKQINKLFQLVSEGGRKRKSDRRKSR